MVRKNRITSNPLAPTPGWLVTDEQIDEARAASEQAAAHLAAAQQIDVNQPQWAARYEAALAAASVASGRVDALVHLRQAQVEQTRRRAELVRQAAPELDAMGERLAASRDGVGAAAAAHLEALQVLEEATRRHNGLLEAERRRVAEIGISAEHGAPEGTIGNGLRLNGQSWTPIPAGAIAAHGIRAAFASAGPTHPLAMVGKYAWRPGDVEQRTDCLRLPTIAAPGLSRSA